MAGTVKLAGIKKEDIFNIANELVNNEEEYNKFIEYFKKKYNLIIFVKGFRAV